MPMTPSLITAGLTVFIPALLLLTGFIGVAIASRGPLKTATVDLGAMLILFPALLLAGAHWAAAGYPVTGEDYPPLSFTITAALLLPLWFYGFGLGSLAGSNAKTLNPVSSAFATGGLLYAMALALVIQFPDETQPLLAKLEAGTWAVLLQGFIILLFVAILLAGTQKRIAGMPKVFSLFVIHGLLAGAYVMLPTVVAPEKLSLFALSEQVLPLAGCPAIPAARTNDEGEDSTDQPTETLCTLITEALATQAAHFDNSRDIVTVLTLRRIRYLQANTGALPTVLEKQEARKQAAEERAAALAAAPAPSPVRTPPVMAPLPNGIVPLPPIEEPPEPEPLNLPDDSPMTQTRRIPDFGSLFTDRDSTNVSPSPRPNTAADTAVPGNVVAETSATPATAPDPTPSETSPFERKVRDYSAAMDARPVMRLRSRILREFDQSEQDLREALLIAFSEGSRADVRAAAVKILAVIGERDNEDVINILLYQLNQDQDLSVRFETLKALGKLASASDTVIRALAQQFITDESGLVRRTATEQIVLLGAGASPVIVQTMVDILQTGDEDTRIRAALALGNLPKITDAATQALVTTSNDDPSSTVRSAAGRALVLIRQRETRTGETTQ